MQTAKLVVSFGLLLVTVLAAGVGVTLAQTSTRHAQTDGGAQEDPWVLHTRRYASAGDTWDAYLVNGRTGEVFFINQNISTRVVEGKPKGAKQ